MHKQTIQEKIDTLALKLDTDIIIYVGDIERGWDEVIIEELRTRKKRKNILLILSTTGGDPDAAYRISRCLQSAYKTVEREGAFAVFIHGLCKSAGTLICLGANKVIMSENGELGPIDTQLPKKGEVRGWTSGLTPIQAEAFLHTSSARLFRHHLNAILDFDVRIPTEMATNVAAQLTIGLMNPLYAQLDPNVLAEVDRSLQIARDYGSRLQNGNLKTGALDRLLSEYPSHEFVIDRKEAAEIFTEIEYPCEELLEIGHLCRSYSNALYESGPCVWYISISKEPACSSTDAAFQENDIEEPSLGLRIGKLIGGSHDAQ